MADTTFCSFVTSERLKVFQQDFVTCTERSFSVDQIGENGKEKKQIQIVMC